MPDRTILLGLMSYIDEKEQPRFGLQGETVTVHSDFVDKFDELNVDPGPPFDPIKQSDEVMSGAGAKPVQKRAPAKK